MTDIFPAVFLDRDGTINLDVDYVFRIEDFSIIPGSLDAIRMLNDAGYKVIVVTNQSGIGRGFYTEDDMHMLHEHLQQLCRKHGGRIDAFFYCPHHPDATLEKYRRVCPCRKPGTEMIERATKLFPLDLSKSWVIGDSAADMGMARNAGLRRILVQTGKGLGADAAEFQIDFTAENLYDAVSWLTGKNKNK